MRRLALRFLTTVMMRCALLLGYRWFLILPKGGPLATVIVMATSLEDYQREYDASVRQVTP